ncbi:hypothetical protein C482_01105 [Natrialba chahannaoensis JCM 10990]|uniref:Probable inorganic carbon transporter subunit DabA n=1 Tax=Natrialba chahannaoensis JCM 10990 TaxID=1227492 RepID=M0B6C5_9EURY|nr:DUF2309 domain-containing protein [Natrialba chahannaoensis]ELZ06375.1 hypothetical protein C482_01105 [Natrialba chahannaoensis JCM 10990]
MSRTRTQSPTDGTDGTDIHEHIRDSIDRAADTVGSVWPLHSFVTANPLSGFEHRPFHRAVDEAQDLFGGRGYPHPSVFRQAWEDGRIDSVILDEELAAHGVDRDPEALLEEMEAAEADRKPATDEATERVDRVLTKWLASFLEQGEAQWSMPNREAGFYAAWRTLAPYDGEIPCDDGDDLPETPLEALEAVLGECPEPRWDETLEHHLASLPGWTGLIKQREASTDSWQERYPITITEYLAVRLTLSDLFNAPTEPGAEANVDEVDDATGDEAVPIPERFLSAWEESYRHDLLECVDDSVTESSHGDGERPAAQLVFCIDTRSEIIRRHLEAQGPYETHGYAGFFGIPMRHQGYDSAVEVDACPPILEPEHRVVDRPRADGAADADIRDRWSGLAHATRKHFKRLKTNVVAAFTFIEGAGSAYGSAMAARTLFPSSLATLRTAVDERVPRPGEFCSPTVDCDDHEYGYEHDEHDLSVGMTHEQRVEYAQTAFDLMGWTEFARLVVFTGHASHTTNNPFDSSLDCGACAGNPGGPNARALAAICNDEGVRTELRERGYDIPEDTVFLAGEHNTTTDAVTLFDGDVPESHAGELERLRENLEAAREAAATERVASMAGADPNRGVAETERRAVDWAETRPEWGLAGNAGFVIGPRELTDDASLEGRAFLHSYDWTTDPDGEALEAIMAGPLVVTQWINNQYYFATVDNGVYGSGSKVTQNPVGNVGVVQGNGGDLMTGLPLQSLKADDERPFHQPLRLSAVIHAPVDRVTEILREHDDVERLVANGWIGGLTVVDPTQDNRVFHYQGDLEWEPPVVATVTQQPAGSPATSD